MTATAVAIWLTLLGPSQPGVGDVIPPGLHPAATLIAACAALDSTPLLFEHPTIGDRPVWVRVAITVSQKSSVALEVLLRTAGVHRLYHSNVQGHKYWYLTTDPKSRPPEELGFQVKYWRVQHVEVAQVAEMLNTLVASREGSRTKEELRTSFIAHPESGTLLVRYRSAQDLVPYEKVLHELDRPPAADMATLRHWRPSHRKVANLAPELEREWLLLDHPPLGVVAHQPSNTLLLRVTPRLWPKVERLLERLDRPQPNRRDPKK